MNNTCSIEWCAKPVKARSWCPKHYSSYWRTGDPLGSADVPNHGLSNTYEYGIWHGMKDRCYNPNRREYKWYGGKGVRVCERWIKSPATFIQDMGIAPTPKHTIDRIDSGGDYEPSNCRWATMQQQSVNRKAARPNRLGYRGVIKSRNSTKFIVQIRQDPLHLRFYVDSAEGGANLYDQLAIQLHGEFAVLNFEYF